MAEIKVHCTWLRPGTGMAKIGDIEGNRNVEIYVDQMPTSIIPNNTFRIIAILEPFGDLKSRMLNYFNKFPDRYNHIFTYHQDILDSFRNSSRSAIFITTSNSSCVSVSIKLYVGIKYVHVIKVQPF